MFFCHNCNNSLDITKNINVKKVEKNIINSPKEFIKLYNDTNTENYFLNFNVSSLKLYLKKENINIYKITYPRKKKLFSLNFFIFFVKSFFYLKFFSKEKILNLRL